MRGNEYITDNYPMPLTHGANVRCYDNGGKTIDRYTVVFMDQWRHQLRYGVKLKLYTCLAMDSRPSHPQGFGQHSECMIGKHLGKRVPFASLPEKCRKAVLRDLNNNDDSDECELMEVQGTPSGEAIGTCKCGKIIYRSHFAAVPYHAIEGKE